MGKYIFTIGVVLIMGFGLLGLTGCDGMTADDRVVVTIKAEFREKFDKEEFSVEDFAWDNIEKIVFGAWSSVSNTGRIEVFLKQHGKKQVKEAMNHLKTIDFVKNAEPLVYNLQPN